jgi:hypothetical protein
MARCVHALEVSVVEALLRDGTRHLRVTGTDNTAGEEPHAGPHGRTFTATQQAADGGAEHRPYDRAADAGADGRVGRHAALLTSELATRDIISLELVPCFAASGHRRHRRTCRHRDAGRKQEHPGERAEP